QETRIRAPACTPQRTRVRRVAPARPTPPRPWLDRRVPAAPIVIARGSRYSGAFRAMAGCRAIAAPSIRIDSIRSAPNLGGWPTMRGVTVATEDGPRACGVYQEEYVDVHAADPELPASVRELLALGSGWEHRAWAALPRGAVRHDPAGARLLAPVPDPRKIIC